VGARFSLSFQTGPEVHPASCRMDTGVSFRKVKQPVRKADHSTPSTAEVKNEWNYIFIPPICLHGLYRDNFTFICTECVKCVTRLSHSAPTEEVAGPAEITDRLHFQIPVSK
jgi:hypothetical protein